MKRKKKKTIFYFHLCYFPSQLMRFDGLASGFEGVDHQMCHASHFKLAHQSPDHLPTFNPWPRLPRAYFCSTTESRHQSEISRIKDDTSRGTKDRTAQLPMWQQEWHLWHHCPLQFVINHANIPKPPILSPFQV